MSIVYHPALFDSHPLEFGQYVFGDGKADVPSTTVYVLLRSNLSVMIQFLSGRVHHEEWE